MGSLEQILKLEWQIRYLSLNIFEIRMFKMKSGRYVESPFKLILGIGGWVLFHNLRILFERIPNETGISIKLIILYECIFIVRHYLLTKINY